MEEHSLFLLLSDYMKRNVMKGKLFKTKTTTFRFLQFCANEALWF